MPLDFYELLADSSRKLADIVTLLVLENPETTDDLIRLALSDKDPHSCRASRVFALVCEKYPELFQKQQNILISNLSGLKSEGVRRNILKIVAEYPVKLNLKNRGILLGLCFDWLDDESKAVAIRVYAMQYLFNASLKEPAIRTELISMLEDHYAMGSTGFRSRADSILRKLYKKL
jgi:hypothetical protein